MTPGSSNKLYVHRMQMHIKCTDEDADALKRLLAATVFDRYEMNGPKAVFSVNVEPDISISPNEYVIALCMSELEKGLNSKQINRLLTILPESGTYMPIEFHAANISAYGFISVEYYKSCDYDDAFLDLFDDVLEEMSLESPDVVYEISDGRKLYMGYLKEGQCE